ncbi:hypothetical protein [Streptomyces sp. NPDC088794]
MTSQPLAASRFVFDRTPSVFECTGATPSANTISLQLNEPPWAGRTAISR